MTRDPAWMASGNRLVYRIIVRRRLRCLDRRQHDATRGNCKACGVHY